MEIKLTKQTGAGACVWPELDKKARYEGQENGLTALLIIEVNIQHNTFLARCNCDKNFCIMDNIFYMKDILPTSLHPTFILKHQFSTCFACICPTW